MKLKLKKIYFLISDYINHIIKRKGNFKTNFVTKIKMYILGFKSDDYILYNLEKNNRKDYVTELERWKTRWINGKYNLCLDDKYIFFEMFNKYVDIPKNLFIIKNGSILDFNEKKLTDSEFVKSIKKYEDLILKPNIGGGGKNVEKISFIDDAFFLDDNKISQADLLEHIHKRDNTIVVEFAKQAAYAKKIFSKTTNTVRIITIYSESEKKYIIPCAIHRFGNSKSIPVDNICRGGYVTEINIDNGVLGKTRSMYDTATFNKHPETNELIEGIKIPHWDYIKSKLLDVAIKFPYIKYIAWDVLVTEDSFKIIEANASSDLDIFQISGGIKNSEFGKFLKENHITK